LFRLLGSALTVTERPAFGGLDREELTRRSREGRARARQERADRQAELAEAASIAEMDAAYNRELAEVKVKANPGKEMIGPLAAALATRELLALLRGDYPITNAQTAMKVVEVANQIARLADGDPTSIAVTSTAEKRELASALRELSKKRAIEAETAP
jgi:hypothetical protein